MGFDEAFQAADSAVRAVREDGLRDIERVVLQGSWNRQTYQEIATDAGYTEGYLSRDVGPALWTVLSDALGMQVKKTNFRTAIERWSKSHDIVRELAVVVPELNGHSREPQTEAAEVFEIEERDPLPFDIADFRGRREALIELSDWIVQDRGRLLCLSGIPRVGKTWFAVKLAEQVQPHFRRFIFQDLSDRPVPLDLMSLLLHRLKVTPKPEATLRECMNLLIKSLTQQETLIVLDATEVFCCPKTLAGTYEPPFEDYRQFLEALVSHDHQSCVFWVGREVPRTVAPMAGSSCRFYTLPGLTREELPALVSWPVEVKATDLDWQDLGRHFGGLPALILSEVVPRLSSFGNSLKGCLTALQRDNRFVKNYVDGWLSSLSEVEWQTLTWLMISHRPLSLADLSDYLGLAMPLEAVESLCDRGVCRSVMTTDAPCWELELPELLIPYLCDRFLAKFRTARDAERIELLHHYPLVQVYAPEVVRQWQQKTLLEAVATLLGEMLPNFAEQQLFLQKAIQASQEISMSESAGYSAGNLMNIAKHWQVSLVNADFEGLQLREADLQSDLFQGVSFAGADLSHTLLAKPMGESPVIAVNPSQPQLAVGDRDGRLLLWNSHDGRLQRPMLTVSGGIRAIAFSYDGFTLAEGREDGQIRLWDLRSEYGPELFATEIETVLTVLLFSPNKQILVGGDDTGNLYVWRLDSGEEIYRLQAHEASITAITFSPCSRRIITCGQDCAAVEWDAQTGERLHRFQGRLTNLLGTVAYVPAATESGAQAVVIGRDEGQLVIWDIPSARPLRVMNEPCDFFMALALSPDGRYLAASDVSNTVSIWEVNSRSRLHQISESSAPIESLVFSPDGRELITGCDYTVQRWQVKSGECLRIWRSDRHPSNKLALASRPLQLLSSHDDQTLRCWQFSQARQCWLPQERLQIPDTSMTSALITSIQGQYWAVGTEAGRAHIWNRTQQSWLTGFIRLPNSITALAFSDDEVFLAVGDAVGTVTVWNLPERMLCWQKKQAHADRVMSLTFTPDSERLFSGSRDRTIKTWDNRGDELFTLSGHRRRVHTLCLSADGNTLYSGSYDGTIRCWNISQQKCIRTWQRDEAYIYWVTLDDHNEPVAIVCDTETVEIWDITENKRRATLDPHEGTIWHISTSPDGQAIVCAGQNGTIDIWSLNSREQQGQLRIDRPYEGMQIGGCLGLTDSERQMLYSLGATDY
ncbi:WD40 repeat domain-containing protein [Oscillatoria sp. CS-180]|nr:WD40 repeat domain-containing protein [Oscillatoria sp. CS-180]